jgi:hypothetical protein
MAVAAGMYFSELPHRIRKVQGAAVAVDAAAVPSRVVTPPAAVAMAVRAVDREEVVMLEAHRATRPLVRAAWASDFQIFRFN